MNLAQFPRRRYTEGWTPLEKLTRLSAELGGPEIYMKRDDLLGLAAGGNKTRKLEFLVADALSQGADTLITCGAVQSNHCRLTLAAAVKEGLRCRLVLEERVPGSYNAAASGNNFLFQLLGVEKVKVVPGGSDMMQEMQKVANELAAKGRKGYVIPGGGSNPIGATGYVSCAEEILHQTFLRGLTIDRVVTASGSGGTHAGMVAGFHGNNAGIPIVGINVSRPKKTQEELIYGLGYSLATPGMIEAVQMLARIEGILMDPVYTGKAMAGLIDLVRKGYFNKGERVLFLHTGGSPALYHYKDIILERK
jgi:D-cysteine desulfhydrase